MVDIIRRVRSWVQTGATIGEENSLDRMVGIIPKASFLVQMDGIIHKARSWGMTDVIMSKDRS
jgi:hypothetical protein